MLVHICPDSGCFEPFTFRGAGIGGLGITVEGPSESKMSCKDNKDGSCSVEYVPFSTGLYDVNITYGGEHIPGESAYLNMMSLQMCGFTSQMKSGDVVFK